MATISSFEEQCKQREPDWKGSMRKRFRWRTLRFEWGRFCYVVHPVEEVPDKVWWEWEHETPIRTPKSTVGKSTPIV